MVLIYALGTLQQAQGTPSNNGTFAEPVEALVAPLLNLAKHTSHFYMAYSVSSIANFSQLSKPFPKLISSDNFSKASSIWAKLICLAIL